MSLDAGPTRSTATGTHVVTMESGEKLFSTFQGTGVRATAAKDGKLSTSQGTYTYAGGTGKLKGIKGKGTYKTTFNPDGTSTVEYEGEYELPKTSVSKPN